MKKIVSITLALMMLLGMLTVAVSADVTAWDGSTDTSFAGSGTASNPYQITSAAELAGLAVNVNGGMTYAGKYFVLMNDIVFNEGDSTTWGENAPANKFTAIGDWNNAFGGSFDGNGKTISGLYINSTADGQGLFGVIQGGAVIKNFALVNSYVKTTGGGCTGAIVGQSNRANEASILIENIYTDAAVVANGGEVGGIFGNITDAGTDYEPGDVTIKNCVYSGTVSAEGKFVGGMVGNARDGKVYISGCAFYGEVYTTSSNVSGLYAGEYGFYEIENSISAGSVEGNTGSAYAIAFNSKAKSNADEVRTINNCYYLDGSASNGATKNADAEAVIVILSASTELIGSEAAVTVEGFTKRENDIMIPTAMASFAPSTSDKYTVEYTVTWENEDGTVLATETYNFGEMPEYKGEIPTKAEDDKYIYTFNCWSPEVVSVSGDASYVAEFYRTRKDVEIEEEEENTENNATTETNAPATEAPENNDSGCASAIGGAAIALVTTVGLAAVVFSRKKED